MKKNYQAWQVDPKAFDPHWSLEDQIFFLIRFAVLAPSGHNSQPWKFHVNGSTLRIETEEVRALPMSDPNHRQLYISLGCALKNCLVAADYFGFNVVVSYGGQGAHAYTELTFARAGDIKNDPTHLIFSIPQRHTNRNKYAVRSPGKEFLDRVSALADEESRVIFVSEDPEKEAIANVVAESNIAIMDDQNFRKELSGYVKANTTTSPIGMPMFGFGMPTPPSFFAPFILRHFNMNKLSKKDDALLLEKFTPVFGIICTKGDDASSWIKAGTLYEGIALSAAQAGVNTAPMAAVIQFGDFHKKVKQILHTDLRPQVFFRMGYAEKATPHSPRLTSHEVTAE